jgi:hypothetical protein
LAYLRRSRFCSLWQLAKVSFEVNPHLFGIGCRGIA